MKKLFIPAALVAVLLTYGILSAQTELEKTAAQPNGISASFAAQSATGTTNPISVNAVLPKTHTILAVTTGGPATCTINIEGSLDGTNWAKLTTDQTCTSTIQGYAVDKPVRFIRVNLSVLSGGTAPTVTSYYTGVR